MSQITPKSELNLLLLQASLHWHNPAANRAMFEEMASAALSGQKEVDMIVLPEMFTTGFTMHSEAWAEVPGLETERWMKSLAQRYGAWVVGSYIVKDKDHYYNRLVAMDESGQVAATYNKRHLFRMAGEHEHFAAGEERVILDVKGWKVCPLVCYDLRFPVWSRNAGMAPPPAPPLQGGGENRKGFMLYDLLLYVANWPAARDLAWQTLLRARAIENLSYCVGLNRIGEDGNGNAYAGNSQANAFDGETLKHLQGIEGGEVVSLSYKALISYRERFPAYLDADIYNLEIAPKSYINSPIN